MPSCAWSALGSALLASALGLSSDCESSPDPIDLRSCSDGLIGSNRGLIFGETLGVDLGDLEVLVAVLLFSFPIFLLRSGIS